MYEAILQEQLETLRLSGQYRQFTALNRICGHYPMARLPDANGSEVVVWCSNDYLGMSQHPDVRAAMHEAVEHYGAGAGGSRNIGGTHQLFNRLEASLAEWHDKDAALVFPTGFGSNDATLQCLLRALPNCVVFSDELNHASIINGIRAAGGERQVFRHNDVEHLRQLLASYPLERPKIVVFESIYSMDGDRAPIVEILNVAKQYHALTYLDEVHAVGMYGPRGAGLAAELGVQDQVDIIQGTMAKAIGIIGGYIASTSTLIDAVRSLCTGFIFTTALPPAVVGGCLASIEHLKYNDKERQALHDKTRLLRNSLERAGIAVMPASTTHVLPILIGDGHRCKSAAQRLLNVHGVYLQPINSPSVPVGSERFRVNVTPNHSERQIEQLTNAIQETFRHFEIPLAKHPLMRGVA